MTAPSPATTVIEHPAEWPVHDEESVARVTELVRRGRTFDYRHGPEIREIEGLFADHLGGRHALAVNSGTSALLAAYYALGLGPGDEVLVPSLTFLATASPLFLLGAAPVLCDSAGPSGTVTARTLTERITPRTRAVAVTHLFGHPAPMDEIMALARRHGLLVVEDCSHAHGSTVDGRPVGSWGDAAVFSIGGLKLISGGMGGILATRQTRHHELACLLTAFRQRSEATVRLPDLRPLADVGLGGNLRISPIAAVLAAGHMRQLAELVRVKRDNAGRLLSAFAGWPGIEVSAPAAGHTMGGWYDIVVEVDPDTAGFDRDELIRRLQQHGVRARVPMTGPLHRTSVFTGARPPTWSLYPEPVLREYFSYRPEDLPVSAALHDRWVSLPGTFLNQPCDAFLAGYREAIGHALADAGGAA
ncbi:DegT/DnrJ/EryC1/StrS family aminotransferase [Paractinoplanes hotanensis]|uniref:DegT/DnrJ/EryC1/StrS family aminotransferase n=1 Tax=Paractinoplanes hotanensis TaxID=2906497 RepID=A0ABT0YCY2_9ACTN|nr:DegT/DnrJ/EryC1/StrS family aminotransferase [Actinoplanes hotanensis]MCM4083104.1 DegT/DnrJ/EryC1/StrS family aminotransferase [Actinoplanes hotanensis]